ncbi:MULTISPECIES: biotin/lipoyl-containing protein [unclassified Mesotoga]|uniref:biotin/lipoyl-containing protein n=1 Tax=unclassified Mesotoga TaxID=1184398 RepID=UPI000DA68FB0|nr:MULTISPECIES: biotin/lipoyl-containing protein [unclassified Mesotoga]PZC52151.1 biotin attachment protein [Mesotoga sp. TolDC]
MRRFRVRVNGKDYDVEIEELSFEADSSSGGAVKKAEPRQKVEPVDSPKPSEIVKEAQKPAEPVKKSSGPGEEAKILSPMSGTILEVLVSVGDSVAPGQKLVILEAMKMENSILSEDSGTVSEVRVKKGDNIDAGEIMIVLT